MVRILNKRQLREGSRKAILYVSFRIAEAGLGDDAM